MNQTFSGTRFIFVSHSGEDTWVACQIAREIQARGASALLDVAGVEIGEEFEEKIRGFLDKAHELVVLFTPWSLKRPYVWTELGAAWLRQIPIVVVLHGLTSEDFRSLPEVPIFVKTRDFVKLNEIEGYFDQLSKKVTKAL